MKTQAGILSNITNDYVNDVDAIVRAEWKMNQYYRTVVDNTPIEDDNGYDIELFPIESITMPNRPLAGICKAVVGQSFVEPRMHVGVPSTRFYVCDQSDLYKYWQSPNISSGTTMSNCAPQVYYVQEDDVSGSPVPLVVPTNKIHFTVETGYAKPATYDVQVKATSAASWSTVSSNVTVPTNGLVELWYNGSAWTTTPDYTHTTTMYGVRLVVNTMNVANSFFNLIELGYALELDLSADVINIGDQQNMGDPDFISPLGNISSNQGSISLFSDTDLYTKENASGILYGLLDKGAKVVCTWDYGSGNKIQEFELYSDTWVQDEEDNVTLNLIDNTTYLQTVKPPAVLYQSIPVQEAVWRICDVVGFNKYAVTAIDTSAQATIDIFWTDGQKSAWEVFGELARATQTAIYFDSFGVLQIKTRDTAWDDTKSPSQTLLGASIPGGQPANIVTLQHNTQYEANKITANWKPTGFSELRDNVVPFEVVWEPAGDVVLRASELKVNMTSGSTTIILSQQDGSTWPFKGICQIDGEYIAYEGKTYQYYDSGSVRRSKTVKDLVTQQKLDAATPASLAHLNHYTGVLVVKTRGLWNSEAKAHTIDLSNWTKTRQFNPGSTNSPCTGIVLNKGQSSVSISGPKRASPNDFTYLHHGLKTDAGYYYLGFRMKFNKSTSQDKAGGMAFNMDGTGLTAGYYIDVMASTKINGKTDRNEVVLYSYKDDGTRKIFGGQTVVMRDKSKDNPKQAKTKVDQGVAMAVVANDYIDFDIIQNAAGDNVSVWANGRFLFQTNVTGGWTHSRNGRIALYSRGNSDVSFDYAYAIANAGIDPVDNEGYYDRIDGAYRANQWQTDWTYEVRQVRRKIKKKWHKIQQKYNQRFYEEFGPVVHEVRQFDVKFTSDTPCLEAKIYNSNTSQVVCTEFTAAPMGASFILANISRTNAIANGDDELTAKGNGTINWKMFVYGRPAIQKDAQQVIWDDTWAQRRRGIIDLEFDSDWIQNQEEADRLGDWMTSHWSRSDSTLDVEVFGNPLVELTDVVHVTYEDIDDNYYVTAINNNYDEGLATTLTLRKVSV